MLQGLSSMIYLVALIMAIQGYQNGMLEEYIDYIFTCVVVAGSLLIAEKIDGLKNAYLSNNKTEDEE